MMADIDVLDYLETAGLLQMMTREDLESLDPRPEWVHLRGGETLIRQGETGSDYFLLVSGRLRVFVTTKDGTQRSIAYINPGQGIGEMSLITGEPRTATIRAKIDSRLIRFSGKSFRTLMMSRPEVAMEIVRTVVHRLRDEIHKTAVETTISSIAILPICDAVDVESFSDEFYASLRKCGSACFINRLPDIKDIRNSSEFMDATIHALQSENNYLIFLAENHLSEWTRKCLLQADLVLLVGSVHSSPDESRVETEMLADLDRFMIERVELVLQHPARFEDRAGMSKWLDRRPHVADFHHVRAGNSPDIEKLARCISGTSNHVVLGGGGARGFAHIGVLKALTEAGIAIDRIGGTSIGAIISAQYAGIVDFDEWSDIVHRIFIKERSAGDYTFPFVSFLRGRRMHNAMSTLFGERDIEDLPTRFFCVSSDLGLGKMIIHTRGKLWRAVRASASVPIIGPPLYQDGSALIDGGLFNNLPTDIMKDLFRGSVIAVDVSQGHPLVIDPQWFDSTLSGWTLLFNRLNPFATRIALPHLLNILYRTMTLYSTSVVDHTRAQADMVIIPPVERFSIAQFASYKEIIEIGYQHTIEQLEKLDRSGGLRPGKIQPT
jgi:predicted acylesterase/phospholipase RssA/CRP-like cAMP-binding protein